MEELSPQDPPASEPAIDSEEVGTGKADDTSATAQRQKRMFFITFGSIVFVGLALTILYLGGRVMETRAAGALASKPQPVAQQHATKPAVITPVQTAVPKPEPAEEPPSQNEPKRTEDPKPQLVAEANPAPAAPKPFPVPEAKPVPASAPTAPKPLPVSELKPAPAPTPKALVALNTPAESKQTPTLESKSAPVPASKLLVAGNIPATPAPQANTSQAASVALVKPAAPPANPAPPAAATKHPEDRGVLTRAPKPYDGPFLKPHPGETYVQVGAYSPNYTGSFLAILERKGFHGTVAPGPSQDVNRVLVGPFSDPDVIKNTYSQLGKAGLAGSFGRKY